MLYEFRGIPMGIGDYDQTIDGEFTRIRAAAREEEGQEVRYCGFCGRALKPGTDEYDEHYHRSCTI